MMVEAGIGILLTASGFAVLWPLRHGLEGATRTWLSLPVGASIYLVVALTLLVITGTLDPRLALGVTGVIGILAFEVAAIRGGLTRHNLGWLVVAVGTAVAVVVLARLLHLTRLTPDSLRHLLFAAELSEAEAVARVHPADLLRRQMGLPALQALSGLTDRRYLASLSPLFGVFGLGFFAWLLWRFTSALGRRRRLLLVLTPVLFLGASNRLVYDSFYINTHIQLAAYLLIAVAGVWLLATTQRWEWTVPAGVALGVSLLFRPEAPLVAATILMVLAATRIPWAAKLAMTAPTVLVSALWYGVVLWNHTPGGNIVAITAPVFGNLVAVAAAVSVVALDRVPLMSRATAHADRVMVAGLAALLVVFGVSNLEVPVDSAVATAHNLAYAGRWLVTWPAAIVLVMVALIVHRIPHGRVWTSSILGFGALFWLLPLLRDGSWRIGPGDSGNRILAHILPVVVAFLVLAAIDSWPSVEDEEPDRVREPA